MEDYKFKEFWEAQSKKFKSALGSTIEKVIKFSIAINK